MSIKLFVTDLDGTLLPTGREVPQENIDAVRDAVRQGIIVTLATGRMYRAALPIAESLGVDVPIITYNGALIKSTTGDVLYTSYLPEKLVAEAVTFCQEHGWHVNLYSDDRLYYAKADKYTALYEEAQQIKGEAVGAEGLKKRTAKVTKLLSVADSDTETLHRVRTLRNAFAGKLDVFRSATLYTEMVNPGVSKAAALKKLAAKLNISLCDTAAIGDSDNDIPLLQAAGLSIAMGNAVPAVKAVAAKITTTCEEFGFALALRQICDGVI